MIRSFLDLDKRGNFGCPFALFFIALLAACSPEPQDTPQDDAGIDLIVRGAHIVTMDAQGTIIENGAIAVDQGSGSRRRQIGRAHV